MIFGADDATQIAYIALVGTLAVPIITGLFGVYMSNRNRQTSADTTDKIDRSARRISAFEDLYLELRRERRARQLLEERCDRQAGVIIAQAAQIRDLETPPQEQP